MTSARRRLLGILAAVVALSAVVVGSVVYRDFRRERVASIRVREEQIAGMEERINEAGRAQALLDSYETELARRRSELYGPGDMDVFTFGMLMGRVLAASGVHVERYHTVDAETPTLEFSIDGNTESVVSFLRQIEEWPKRLWIPVLSLRAGGRGLEGSFRVSYETPD